MNVADNGIVAAKTFKCRFHSRNCMAETTDLFVFGKISAQEQHVVHYSIAHKRSQLRKKVCQLTKRHTLAQCLLVEFQQKVLGILCVQAFASTSRE